MNNPKAMSEKIKLLPCPFCGGEVTTTHIPGGRYGHDGPSWEASWKCSCTGCGMSANKGDASPELAAATWNRRAPQPVAVIAPAIEWHEWGKGPHEGTRYSKCNRFILFRKAGKTLVMGKDNRAGNQNPNITDVSEDEAIAYCQSLLQTTIDRALEGCNVRPWRDPQPLVDDIETILYYRDDTSEWTAAANRIKETLKAWEAGA